MNPDTRQHLITVAAQRAHSHPAAVQRPLTQGSSRYRTRLWVIHGAVIVLAALLLGAGILTERPANTPTGNLPPVTEPTPVAPAGPSGPGPTAPGPTSPGPTNPTDPAPERIALDPRSFAMAPGERLLIRAWGIYDDGSRKQIPAAELSWDVNNAGEYLGFPNIASVDTTLGTDGILIANSTGEVTLTVSMPEAEQPQTTAEITVGNIPRNPVGPTDLQNPNSTTSPATAIP